MRWTWPSWLRRSKALPERLAERPAAPQAATDGLAQLGPPPSPTAGPVPRRSAVGVVAGVMGVLTAALLAPRRSLAGEQAPEEEADPAQTAPRSKWGMAIDLDKCSGCGGCVVACQEENNVPSPPTELAEQNIGIYWMDLVEKTSGSYPDLQTQLLPLPCMQCEDPPCVKVCPVGATFVGEDGIVSQIWDRCIGCRYCMTACPYSRRQYNWTEPQWPESEKSRLNPAVATRPTGVVEKCTFCQHRIRAVRERSRIDEEPLTDADFRRLPACAQSCPADAITFGDLNDPDSEVTRLHKSPRATRLLEDLGTKPKVVYLRETKWRE